MDEVLRRLRPHAYPLLAGVAALATALFIYHFVAQAGQRVPVLVATRDIAEGAQIDPSMVRVAEAHPSGLHLESLAQAELAVGRYSLVPVHMGEQLLDSQLSSEEGNRGFLAQMASDERAIFIPLSLGRGLGGAVAPGDRVDVVFVASEQKLGQSGVATVLRRARVLDVRSDRGLSLAEDRPGKGAEPGFLGVMLAVKAQEAERIAFYLEHGQLFLTLTGYRPDAAEEEVTGTYDVPPLSSLKAAAPSELQPVAGEGPEGVIP